MNSLQRLRIPILATLVAAGLTMAGSARANVFASNIKVNGSLTNSVSAAQGSSVAITYILNEAATAGVTINIASGGTTVRTITIASGAGTTKGLNTVNWDGKDGSGNNVATGTYSVSVTAAATGFSDWTVTSSDTSPNTYSWRPYGIGVDKNTNSPYYGRIFIANATKNAAGTAIGDTQGIIKCNADQSYADDGAFSRFDYAWVDDGGDSPMFLKVEADDNLYFMDWTGKGKVVGVDPTLTTSFVVWDAPNYSNNTVWPAGTTSSPNWIDFDIAFVGTDHPMLFGNDANFPSEGVVAWYLTNKTGHFFADPALVLTNDDGSTKYEGDIGLQAIQPGGDLPLLSTGCQVDNNTNIYCFENRANLGDPAMRAGMFPWDGQTDIFTGAAWSVGGADDTFRNTRDIALDSKANPHYLAICEYTTGTADGNGVYSGGIRILNAADGSTVVANLFATNCYRTVGWDNVGNLYAGSSGTAGSLRSHWQVISPAGANQATTPALVTIQVTGAATVPHITSVTANGSVSITFTAGASDSASAFTLQSASTVNGTYTTVAVSATQVSPGVFNFTTPAVGSAQFYRISR